MSESAEFLPGDLPPASKKKERAELPKIHARSTFDKVMTGSLEAFAYGVYWTIALWLAKAQQQSVLGDSEMVLWLVLGALGGGFLASVDPSQSFKERALKWAGATVFAILFAPLALVVWFDEDGITREETFGVSAGGALSAWTIMFAWKKYAPLLLKQKLNVKEDNDRDLSNS